MNVKLYGRLLAATAVILFAVPELPLIAESVFLKDGSIVAGTVISDSVASIRIRTKNKEIKDIPRSNILRLIYAKLKEGRLFVEKRDGDSFEGYLVDEDGETYTFRMDLYKPAEFTLTKNEVLYMYERNPAGLKLDGETRKESVSLKWNPSYNPVKRYNIYLRKGASGKYENLGSTKRKTVTIKNLSPGTVYYVMVTSIDENDLESSPSNERKVTTKGTADGQLKNVKERKAYIANKVTIGIYPCYIYPLGTFGKMFDSGYGGGISYSKRDMFFDDFEGGAAVGFYYMPGKNLPEKNKDFNRLMLLPFYMTAGYNIIFGENFRIKPLLSFGGAYVDMKYFDKNRTAAMGRDVHLQIVEPAFKAGLSAEYTFSDSFLMSVGCEYGAVVEKNGLLDFIAVNAGAGYSF